VIRQDDLRAIADEEVVAINRDAGFAKLFHFLQESDGIEHDSVADDAPASLAEDATGHKLQHKPIAIDNDGVASVVSAGVTGHYGKLLGEHVNDFALTLVAPLRADNDCCSAFLHPVSFYLRAPQPKQGCSALALRSPSPGARFVLTLSSI